MHAPAPAQSPFLPGTQIQFAWDSTSLGYLKTCPRLYKYIMLDGYGGRDESVHLRFGIEYHKGLEDFDHARVSGADYGDAVVAAIGKLVERTRGWEVDEDTKAGHYKNRRTLIRTVLDYLDHFRTDAAQTVVLDSGRPAVELSFKFNLDWGPSYFEKIADVTDENGNKVGEGHHSVTQPYILCGHLDRIVNFGGELYVMDRKTTTATLGPYYFNQYSPNNQMTIYTTASQVVFGMPVKGVIIDAVQIMVDSSRFDRGTTYRTPDQLDEWLQDLRYWLALAEEYARADYWPMNDTACDKFGGCRFREICSKSPSVRERFLEGHFHKQPIEDRWNPLKAR